MSVRVGPVTVTVSSGEVEERQVEAVRQTLKADLPWWTLARLNNPRVHFNVDSTIFGGIRRGATAEIWGPWVAPGERWGFHAGGTPWAVAHELGHVLDLALRPDRHKLHSVFHQGVNHDHLETTTANLPMPPHPFDHGPHGWSPSGRTPHDRAGGEAYAEWISWYVGTHTRISYGMHSWGTLSQQNELLAETRKAAKGIQLFSDVPADSTHGEAINALAAAGVINGFPDGTFRPNDSVTRGQIATILYRAGILNR